jgi:hypothetical protein
LTPSFSGQEKPMNRYASLQALPPWAGLAHRRVFADMVGLLVDPHAGGNRAKYPGEWWICGLKDCLMNKTERKKQCINFSVCSW